ncbi:MAG TPA: hypothetical protein PLE93_00540, partial [Solirubrobacterales bacterium]|nr:hypothetical protein [Solirubrobacterales bacterium]
TACLKSRRNLAAARKRLVTAKKSLKKAKSQPAKKAARTRVMRIGKDVGRFQKSVARNCG